MTRLNKSVHQNIKTGFYLRKIQYFFISGKYLWNKKSLLKGNRDFRDLQC